jgi:hypothetical protein
MSDTDLKPITEDEVCKLCGQRLGDHLFTDDGDFCTGKGGTREWMFTPSNDFRKPHA